MIKTLPIPFEKITNKDNTMVTDCFWDYPGKIIDSLARDMFQANIWTITPDPEVGTPVRDCYWLSIPSKFRTKFECLPGFIKVEHYPDKIDIENEIGTRNNLRFLIDDSLPQDNTIVCWGESDKSSGFQPSDFRILSIRVNKITNCQWNKQVKNEIFLTQCSGDCGEDKCS